MKAQEWMHVDVCSPGTSTAENLFCSHLFSSLSFPIILLKCKIFSVCCIRLVKDVILRVDVIQIVGDGLVA